MGVAQSLMARDRMIRQINRRRAQERTVGQGGPRVAETQDTLRGLANAQSRAERKLHTLDKRRMKGVDHPVLIRAINAAVQAHTDAQSRFEELLISQVKEYWEVCPKLYEQKEERRLGTRKYEVDDQDHDDYLFKNKAKPDSEDNCTFCLESYSSDPGDPRQLPCGHVLHHLCLREWFALESRCALCRQEFRIIRPNGQPMSFWRDVERRWTEEARLQNP